MDMERNKKIVLTLFGYLISLFLLVITFKDTNFKKVFEYLKEINPVLGYRIFSNLKVAGLNQAKQLSI